MLKAAKNTCNTNDMPLESFDFTITTWNSLRSKISVIHWKYLYSRKLHKIHEFLEQLCRSKCSTKQARKKRKVDIPQNSASINKKTLKKKKQKVNIYGK